METCRSLQPDIAFKGMRIIHLLSDVKERELGLASCLPQKQQGQFPRMVVPPHGRFPARYSPSVWNVIPALWAVVHGVEDQSLVLRIGGEVRLFKERAGDG